MKGADRQNIHAMDRKYIRPGYLKKGDKAIIVSPSGHIEGEFIDKAAATLESWGLKVDVAEHAKGQFYRFSGTDRERLDDLQKAFDDPKARLILCSRGGYGAARIITRLDFTKFKECPKWVAGYSDITAIHAAIQTQGCMSLHCQMAKHLSLNDNNDKDISLMRRVLFGEKTAYDIACHTLNRNGESSGILRGGNLSVLYGMRGTPFDLPAGRENIILFIEDINERPYCIDRIMQNLKAGGVLERLSGLIVGTFSGYEEDLSMGKDVYYMIAEAVSAYSCPVCFGFPVGHEGHNLPMICGAETTMRVSEKGVRIELLP